MPSNSTSWFIAWFRFHTIYITLDILLSYLCYDEVSRVSTFLCFRAEMSFHTLMERWQRPRTPCSHFTHVQCVIPLIMFYSLARKLMIHFLSSTVSSWHRTVLSLQEKNCSFDCRRNHSWSRRTQMAAKRRVETILTKDHGHQARRIVIYNNAGRETLSQIIVSSRILSSQPIRRGFVEEPDPGSIVTAFLVMWL